jgi:multidrug resistance efflux pump
LISRRIATFAIKLTVVVALLALVSGGCGSGPTEVTVKRIGPLSIEETVMVAGSLQAGSPVMVIPQVYGPVAQVFADYGQEVVAGQVLVQLDTSSLEQALLSAQAGLESTQAMASLFNSLSSSASGIVAAAGSALASLDAGVAGLLDLERLIIPSLPEEQRLAALQAIDATRRELQAQSGNRAPLPSGGGGYSTAAQEAASMKAIENAQRNLQGATIVAPTSGTLVAVQEGGMSLSSMLSTLMSSFSGMIPSGLNLSALSGLSGGLSGFGLPTSGPLVPGTYVMPGTPIYQIVDLRNMSMVAKVDESDIAKVMPQQKAAVSLEAYPDKEFQGWVSGVADVATTNEAGAPAFDVNVAMDYSDTRLKIGMTGTADLTVAAKKAAVVVPVEALVRKKGKEYVFRVVEGKARLTPVTTGLTTEDRAEITKGVKFGDRVVVQGVDKLKDGTGVRD